MGYSIGFPFVFRSVLLDLFIESSFCKISVKSRESREGFLAKSCEITKVVKVVKKNQTLKSREGLKVVNIAERHPTSTRRVIEGWCL